MHTAMLWFDNSKVKTLEQKIQGAVDYYVKKYGRTPDLCLVHPSMFNDGHALRINCAFAMNAESNITLTVRPYRPVLPGHIWVGMEDKE